MGNENRGEACIRLRGKISAIQSLLKKPGLPRNVRQKLLAKLEAATREYSEKCAAVDYTDVVLPTPPEGEEEEGD
jgi:hypothetical protein